MMTFTPMIRLLHNHKEREIMWMLLTKPQKPFKIPEFSPIGHKIGSQISSLEDSMCHCWLYRYRRGQGYKVGNAVDPNSSLQQTNQKPLPKSTETRNSVLGPEGTQHCQPHSRCEPNPGDILILVLWDAKLRTQWNLPRFKNCGGVWYQMVVSSH